MDTFPSLDPLKGPLLGVSKVDSLLTFAEDVDTTTDSARLELLVRFGLGSFELSSRLPIRLKDGKYTSFGVSRIFEMHPCSC